MSVASTSQVSESASSLEQLDRASVLHPATSIADFASGRAQSTIMDTANGVIVRAMPQSDAIGFAAPLILTRGEADEIVEIASASTRQVIEELTREGKLA